MVTGLSLNLDQPAYVAAFAEWARGAPPGGGGTTENHHTVVTIGGAVGAQALHILAIGDPASRAAPWSSPRRPPRIEDVAEPRSAARHRTSIDTAANGHEPSGRRG
ncbi:hypothetical protein [Allokutzneria multivorans]